MKWLFAPRQIDYGMRAIRTAHLLANAKAYVAYDRLEQHYWHCGSLFREDRELAAASGLSVVSFRLVKGLLIRLFDVDESGFWRDYDLEQDRDATIVELGLGDPAEYRARPEPAATAPAPAAPGAPGQKRSRSEVNRENVNRRWNAVRGLRQAPSSSEKPVDDGRPMQNGMQFVSEPIRNPMRSGDTTGTNPGSILHGFASSYPASSSDDEDDDSRKSSSSSSSPDGPARHTNANGDTNSHPVASPAGRERAEPIYKDAEVLDIILVNLGDKATPNIRKLSTVAPYRELMREGCDLVAHIIPELHAARDSLNGPLRQPCPDWLKDNIRSRRDTPETKKNTASTVDAAHRVFLEEGSEGHKAWLDYYLKRDGKRFTLQTIVAGKKGWGFPAERPPGYAPEAKMALAH